MRRIQDAAERLQMPAGKRLSQALIILSILLGAALIAARAGYCAEATLPPIRLDMDDLQSPQQIAGSLQIVLLLTVLSVAPSILIMTTSFTRLTIVLSFLRQALGTQQAPSNQIIAGLALFMTFFIMQPVWQAVYKDAIVPYQEHKISAEELFTKGSKPLRDFMLKQTRKKDLALFLSLAKEEKPKNAESISIFVIMPAFMISELTTAFQIGFMIYIPFIILDMVVSSILLSMGMMMLPPVMISMPFKLMLFVLVDGWNLLIGSLVKSFQ